ncbi:phospholipid methyltransferase [Rhizobium sp. P32RR-XVIII]|uniref:methyltransferase family protein n=1 Tax=Rhizobium sp. P32RR-XVIII TaxID=2726738 RepID=UPI001456E130|nr:isoprenylcysteine carboxylmethyltransferase family protein [Rhizobium sp. P32RR-XVIII]NLS06555.1 phospholipid methyltransferase [Rhizobium sp. P32RR-XVIII]
MKKTMISIGNFFFRFRNQAFPVMIVGLLLMALPPTEIFGSAFLEEGKDLIALAVVLAGLILRATVIGYAYIQRGGLNKKVYAKNLVTGGMFGICRNPLYVGNMLIYSGLFLVHGSLWVVAAGIALFAFIYQCIIYAEEAFLEDKFGDGYRAYCRDVPRWMPRFGKFAESTEGMEFNFKRVIAKDYSTACAALFAVVAVEAWEYLAAPNPTLHVGYLSVLIALMAAFGVLAGAISFLKKRGVFHEGKAA